MNDSPGGDGKRWNVGGSSALRDWRVVALAAVIVLAGAAKILLPALQFTPLLAVPVVASAAFGRPRVSAALGVLALVVAAIVGITRENPSGPIVPEVLIATVVGIGLAFAVSAWKKRLLAQQRDFQLLAENASDVVIRTDSEGRMDWVSPSTAALLGWPAEELIGRTFAEIVEPDYRDVAFGGGLSDQVRRYDARIIGSDGGTRWMRCVCRPIRDAGSGTPARIMSMSDIQAEVEEREDRLAAEAAAKAKGAFVAHMSHEIRTPLNAIVGFAHLLRESAATDQQRRYADNTVRAAGVLMSTVNDILDFSKIEAEAMELESIPFSLRSVVGDIEAVGSGLAGEKGIEFRTRIDDSVPAGLIGDPLRLEQVLLNFVGNAVKFTDEGSVELSVVVEDRTDQAATVRFTVTDTGIGIPEERMPALFSAFSQADASTTRRFGGTGLGLTICQRIIRLMGSDITVDSVPGVGSSFSFLLTLPTIDADEAPVDPRALEAGRLDGLRIMVAEDNPFNQMVAADILTGLGAHVTVVDDGKQAVGAVADGGSFDVVLMDVQMPVMDGLEATRRLRASEAGDRLVILAMTASTVAADVAACREAGMDDVVAKPIDPASLTASIRQHARA